MEILFSGWGTVKYDEEFLRRFPKLKVIFYAGGSIKSFVTDAFWRRRIRITSSYSANGVPVAEYTYVQIICALKQIWQQVFYMRQHKKYPSH